MEWARARRRNEGGRERREEEEEEEATAADKSRLGGDHKVSLALFLSFRGP